MYNKILAPVDLHPHGYSYQVAYTAVEQARLTDAELLLIKVVSPMPPLRDKAKADEIHQSLLEEERQNLEKFVESLPKEDVKITSTLVEGRPSDAILNLASEKDVDLIVMASHKGQNQLGLGNLGTVTTKVAARSTCQVLIVKPNRSKP